MYWGEYDYATDITVQRREAYNQGIATGAHDARLETARILVADGRYTKKEIAEKLTLPLELVSELEKR